MWVALLAAALPARVDAEPAAVRPDADLRLRSEVEHFDPGVTRTRLRLRARVGARWQPDERVTVGARVSTGSAAPTSSQLTFGDGFDGAPLKLASAYARFRPVPWADLWLGKVPNVFRNRRVVWDRDVHPEGATQVVQLGAPGGRWSGHLSLGEYILVEVEDSTDDVYALAGQVGAAVAWPSTRIALDVGGHAYPNVTAHELPYARDTNSRGADDRLLSEFRLLTALLEVATELHAVQLEAYAEAVENTGADRASTAFALGLEAATRGASLGYEYRKIERDAILDSLAESSWHDQRTGFRGHKLSAAYVFDASWRLATSGKHMRTLTAPTTRQLEWLVDLTWRM